MVLDPFTALGVAGNICQFVDFASKLVIETRTIYKSVSGASEDSIVLDTVAKDLSSLSFKLSQGTTQADSKLRSLASECKGVADDLILALENLRVKDGPNKRWNSFVVALKEVWKKEDLQAMTRRLEVLQRQLMAHLLELMHNQQSSILKGLQSIADDNRQLEMDRVQHLNVLKEDMLRALARLKPEERLLTTTIRSYLDSVREMREVNPGDITKLSERMKDLSLAVSNLAQEGKVVVSEQMLLKSLRFRKMKVRHAKVAAAHPKTFRWIFNDTSEEVPDPNLEPLKYVEWLSSKNGTYYIMGKPGSGKSTLMKFLSDHPDTEYYLRSWAKGKQLVIAKYFFWHAGTRLQKSQEGLLQSLLFEVLRKCPELIARVCNKFVRYIPYQDDPEAWTRDELLDAFRLLREQNSVPIKFCFFIDGLDEYDTSEGGSSEELVEILGKIADSPDIKMCVSSRPWNEFRDHFAQDPARFIVLENLTKSDIRRYVTQKLEENLRFRQMKSEDARYPQLVEEIVERAHGVFLWVFLVVTSLSKGLSNADRVGDLQRRLRELPETLEEYFRHMFNTVDGVYREQTAQAFQFAIQAAEPLSVMTFSFLDEEDPDFALHAKIRPLSIKQVESRQEEMRRRLDGRCKGLLEITPNSGTMSSEPFFQFNVDFLHRTVRDFLLMPDMQSMLKERLQPDFNAKLLLCKAFLAQLKTIPSIKYGGLMPVKRMPGSGPMDDLLEDIFHYARDLEMESQDTSEENRERLLSILSTILDEAQKVLYDSSSDWGFRRKKNMFLGIAVQRDLQFYTKRKLGAGGKLLQTLLNSRARPLLDFALIPSDSKYGPGEISPEMVKILLSSTADPNSRYRDSTVWGRFLCSLHKRNVRSPPKLNGPSMNKELLVMEMLIKHGADLEMEVGIDSSGYSTARRIISNNFPDKEILSRFNEAPSSLGSLGFLARWTGRNSPLVSRNSPLWA